MDIDLLLQASIAFVAFSLVASSIYCINDWRDITFDRLHPIKKNRPLASGLVSSKEGQLLAMVLFGLALGLSLFINWQLAAVILGYFALNLAYSFGLKNIGILDLLCISLGFILRLVAGSVVTGIVLSKWILLMTFLLALFLALGKRRDDVVSFMTEGNQYRHSVNEYSLEFVNLAMTMIASVTIVAYIMYTISEGIMQQLGSDQLFVTVVWVIIGILRYFQLVFVKNQGGSPTRILFKDHFLQIILALWILTFFVLIY